MIGTMSMSALGCVMLRATLLEVGATVYIVGNFAMHYYPLLRVAGSGLVDIRRADTARQALAAAAVVVVYVAVNDASVIYGCPKVPRVWVAFLLTVAAWLPIGVAVLARHFS